MQNSKKKILAFFAIAAVAAVTAVILRDERAKDPQIIPVSGNIEATEAQVSFKIPGRVEVRVVSEGEAVRAGQAIAQLDRGELLREVALRKAEVAAAEAALAELEVGSRPEEVAQAAAALRQVQARLDELLGGSRPQEIAAAEAEVRWAQAEMAQMKSDRQRQSQLFEAGVISSRDHEAAQTAFATAMAKLQAAEERCRLVKEGPRTEEIERARAALAEANERYALIRKGPRQETIDQARARLQQARESLALAETRLEYTRVASPLAGLILSENVEAGEYVSAGTPVVTVGRLDSVWLRAYIDETDLGRVKVGQGVSVSTDTFPGKVYRGRVSFISSTAEFTPKNVQTQKERVKLVYRIKVDIANRDMELKPGMPADARIEIADNREVARGTD